MGAPGKARGTAQSIRLCWTLIPRDMTVPAKWADGLEDRGNQNRAKVYLVAWDKWRNRWR